MPSVRGGRSSSLQNGQAGREAGKEGGREGRGVGGRPDWGHTGGICGWRASAPTSEPARASAAVDGGGAG